MLEFNIIHSLWIQHSSYPILEGCIFFLVLCVSIFLTCLTVYW